MRHSIKLHWPAFVLFYFIFVGEVSIASIFYLSPQVTSNSQLAAFFMYMLQIVFAPFQAGISDRYCRKTSLIIAFCGILLAETFFLLALQLGVVFLGVTVLLFGALGNVAPISRAALIDTHIGKHYRVALGMSTVAIALGWLATMYAAYELSPMVVFALVACLSVIAIPLAVFTFNDPRDKRFTASLLSPVGELTMVRKFMGVRWLRAGFIGYLFGEFAFYLLFCHGNGDLGSLDVRFVITTWVIGYIIGVLFHSLINLFKATSLPEPRAIYIGIIISIGAAILFLFFDPQFGNHTLVSKIINLSFAFGYGLFVPSLFALISADQKLHHQGIIYGLIESTDTVALMLVSLTLAIWAGSPAFWLVGGAIGLLLLAAVALIVFVRSKRYEIS